MILKIHISIINTNTRQTQQIANIIIQSSILLVVLFTFFILQIFNKLNIDKNYRTILDNN